MADEVSTGIKTTCLQYNSTGRSTFHIQVRNSSYFSFFFCSHLELKEIVIFSARNKAFPGAKTSHNITELNA